MKKVTKIIACLLVFVLVITLICEKKIYALNDSDANDGFNMLLEKYLQNDEFKEYYMEDPEDALNMVEQIYLHNSSWNPTRAFVFPEVSASVSTVLVQQPDQDSCGPAATYMAINGLGLSYLISGSTHNAKVATLKGIMMPNGATQTSVPTIKSTLNNYAGTGAYKSKAGSSMGYNGFRAYVFYSINDGYIPILHAVTTNLPYYSGATYYHYIAIQGFDSSTDLMTLYDPHYSNSYYGVHHISAASTYTTISPSGRYLIYH